MGCGGNKSNGEAIIITRSKTGWCYPVRKSKNETVTVLNTNFNGSILKNIDIFYSAFSDMSKLAKSNCTKISTILSVLLEKVSKNSTVL